ncbi:MAG TPA: wax ester/triacylglycerol synthase family O-acyltransferase [Acidimicrobiales bacterium]|nr:wax ester/triacylglycerol synthase family O-acyltransferase [Acidimicrobiales bacterium]
MLRRLNAIDADMLSAETPTWHLHVGGVMLLDASAVPGGLSFDTVKAGLAARVGQAAPLRERVVPVPLGLDRPLWVTDPAFDVDAHVRHVRLTPPGGRHELGEIVGEFAAMKLDRRRPLWEMWFVDGLDDGRVAVLTKVHHAAVDGVAAAFLMAQFLDTQPHPTVPRQATTPVPTERVPSQLELFLRGLGSMGYTPLRVARPLRRTVSSVRGILGLRHSRHLGSPATPFRGPRTSFNRPVTANRSFAFTAVPLADVKAIKNAFGTTVNDVVLALCTTALRRYLQRRDELPDTPLTAAVPVSTRTQGEMGSYGNRVSGLFAMLPTDVADPIERLRAVRGAAEVAKGLYASGVEDALMEWADVPPPVAIALGVRLFTWTHLAEKVPPIFNLLISNVPGSPVPLYLAGAPVAAIYPLGPVLDNIGLNITILSHVDQIDFGLVSCPELMPDLWDLADEIPDALAELISAAR